MEKSEKEEEDDWGNCSLPYCGSLKVEVTGVGNIGCSGGVFQIVVCNLQLRICCYSHGVVPWNGISLALYFQSFEQLEFVFKNLEKFVWHSNIQS